MRPVFVDEEPLSAGAVCVNPPGAAVARPGARHRDDPGEPAGVEGRQAGDLLRLAPDAARLAHDEPLTAAGAACVKPAAAAVAPPGARHRGDLDEPAGVEGRQVG